VQVSQYAETAMQEAIRDGWLYRYGYSRAMESQAAGDPGQDYLTIAEQEGSLQFVLCDGVSQSYYGDLAAKFIGDRLLDWLSDVGDRQESHDSGLQTSLRRYLTALTGEAQTLVRQHHIPPEVPDMLREVLQAKKELGSAAMYCAGRIDLPNESKPDGRLWLVWQGDIRCRIWNGSAEESKMRFGDRFHTWHQWNTTAGAVGGMPHVYQDRLVHGGKRGELLLYSDGLQALDCMACLTDERLAEIAADEAGHRSSDDICYLQVMWDFNSR